MPEPAAVWRAESQPKQRRLRSRYQPGECSAFHATGAAGQLLGVAGVKSANPKIIEIIMMKVFDLINLIILFVSIFFDYFIY